MDDNRESQNRTKRITIIALLLALLACSFGFAAYSRSIDYSDSEDYVMFRGGVLSIRPTVPQNGIVKPTMTKGAVAEEATLTENGIININVHFTAPGQSATYSFFGVNPSDKPVYLNNVIFADKYCEPIGTTTQEEADNSCEDITMTVSIKNDSFKATNGLIDNHVLPAKSNEPITVTLKYNPVNKLARRSFKVDFGISTLSYGQTD